MRQVILNFHGLGRPGRTLEAGEAPYWVTSSFLDECLALAGRLKPEVAVAITFDDGNRSDLEIGAEALARHGLTDRYFVLADRIGQPGSLDAGDLRALAAAGHEVGSHGAAHIDWSEAAPAVLRRELVEARGEIAAALGAPVRAAAIPFGRYNAAVLRALREHGYERIYSSDGGPWREGNWPIPRTSPREDMTLADIEALLLGRESRLRAMRRAFAMAVKRRL